MTFEITDDVCKKAEALAAQGLTMDQIASCLGIARSTMFDKQANYVDFSDAIKTGRHKGIAQVTNYLMESAKKGNVAAQIFYLKNRAKDDWKDSQDLNVKKTIQHTTNDIARERLDELLGEGTERAVETPVSH